MVFSNMSGLENTCHSGAFSKSVRLKIGNMACRLSDKLNRFEWIAPGLTDVSFWSAGTV
jgi:hypothetical protein